MNCHQICSDRCLRTRVHSHAEHWTEVAQDLNTSYTDLTADEDFLRRGQRRQWRKDEQEVLKDNSSLRVETLRSLIAFRGEETAERKVETTGSREAQDMKRNVVTTSSSNASIKPTRRKDDHVWADPEGRISKL